MKNVKEKTLTERLLHYQKTGVGFKQILEELSLKIYTYPLKRIKCTADDPGEFYLFFYPKLMHLLSDFRYCGKPFEHYLNVTLSWAIKSYLRKKRKERAIEYLDKNYSLWKDNLLKEYLPRPQIKDNRYERYCRLAFQYLFENRRPTVKSIKKSRKRIIIIILRYHYFLDNSKFFELVQVAGIDKDWILKKIGEAKKSLRTKEKRQETLRIRRNKAFIRIQLLEKRLSETQDDLKRIEIKEKLGKEKRKMKAAMKELSRIPFLPTYHVISSILNIPKGTVGSCLRWTQNKVRELYHNDRLEYA